MIYRTKVDPWLPMVVSLAFVLPVAIGLYILTSGDGPASIGWILIAAGGLTVAILLVLGWPVTYDPGATRADGEPILLVRGGLLLRYEVPIAWISEVRPSSNPLSSPAWSLDRLEIVYRSPSKLPPSFPLLISPRDRDGFLDELARRAGNLDRDDDRLLRRQDMPAAP